MLDGGRCIECIRGRRDGVTADIRVHCCRQRASAARLVTLTRCWLLLEVQTVTTGTCWHSMIKQNISLNTLLIRQTIDWTIQWSMHQLYPRTCPPMLWMCNLYDIMLCNDWCSVCSVTWYVAHQWVMMLNIHATSIQHPCNIHGKWSSMSDDMLHSEIKTNYIICIAAYVRERWFHISSSAMPYPWPKHN